MAELKPKTLKSKEEEIDLLFKVKQFNCEEFDSREDKAMKRFDNGETEEDDADRHISMSATVTRRVATMSSLSGAGNMVYEEFDSSRLR